MTAAEESDQCPGSIDTAWKIHAALVDWTGKVDTKASFALTLESAALVTVVTLSSTAKPLADLGGMALIAYRVGIALLGLGALCAASVVSPRLRSRAMKRESAENFIYFGHIKDWEPAALATALRQDDVLAVLSRQLVAMSRIAWRKHRQVQWSLISGVTGALIVAATGGLS